MSAEPKIGHNVTGANGVNGNGVNGAAHLAESGNPEYTYNNGQLYQGGNSVSRCE